MADTPGFADALEESAGTADLEQKEWPEATAEDQAVVTEAVDHLAFVLSIEDQQRRNEDDDLYFEGVDAWPEAQRTAREEHTDPETAMTIPAKPTLSVSLLDQTLQQNLNEARMARLALTVKPKAGLANTKTSAHFKGLVRALQADSGAQDARFWALERTMRCGRGAYQIRADYANDGDFDIDLIIERILDQANVFWDPYAKAVDYSDAERCLTTEVISVEDRKRRWPTKPLTPPSGVLEGTTKDNPWFVVGADGKFEAVVIGTFHRVKHTDKILAYHPTVGQAWLTELPADLQAAVNAKAPGTRQRTVDVRSVEQFTIDGTQLLEEKKLWLGRYIPVIPTIGKEYLVKGKRFWKGVVTNTKDIIRAINVMISSATEIAGGMPRIPYIMAEGADSGFETMWDEAGIKNFTRLYYTPKSVDGTLVPPPQRQSYELEIQGLMFLLRMLLDMYHSVTGTVPPSMRATNPYDRSGKAIKALQQQGQAGSSNYLDNLATISMMHEGRVLIDAIPKYYDRPGRILMVMGEENDDETAIMIKVPFVHDGDGNPVPVPCPTCKGAKVTATIASRLGVGLPARCATCQGAGQATKENMPKFHEDKPVEYVDFADGVFKVAVAVERGYKTKQDEALASMMQLAEVWPEGVPMYADLLVRAMGFSGSNEIADRLKAQNPALQGEADLKNVPPGLMAAFQKLKFEHGQAMEGLQQAREIIQGDKVKTAGQKELAIVKVAAQERLERIKLQAKQAELSSTRRGDAAIEVVKGQIKGMLQESQQQHEVLLQLLKEKGAKEEERHSVALHDEAAALAEARLEGREVRAGAREEGHEVRTGAREEGREHRAAARDATLEARATDQDHTHEDAAADRDHAHDDHAAQRDHRLDTDTAAREEAAAARADARGADLTAKQTRLEAELAPKPDPDTGEDA